MRGAAVHEEMNDMLRLRGEVSDLRQQRIGNLGGLHLRSEQAAQAKRAKAHAAAVEQLAARQCKMFGAGIVGHGFVFFLNHDEVSRRGAESQREKVTPIHALIL
jgi:hypothetical protein